MPSVTLKSPLMLMSWDCRQRLGLTLSGAFSPSLMKPYFVGSQMRFPAWPLIISLGRGATSPFFALSKSEVSEKGSCSSSLAFAAFVASVASLRGSWACAAAKVASTATKAPNVDDWDRQRRRFMAEYPSEEDGKVSKAACRSLSPRCHLAPCNVLGRTGAERHPRGR